MSFFSLLKKEVHWTRHNILTLLFLLLVLPSAFAYASIAFGTALPRDVPVAVVAEGENVSETDMNFVKGGMKPFSDPKPVATQSRARRMLDRESVYAVVQVPAGISDPDTEHATFVLTVHGSVVPFKEPSRAIRSIMEFQLDQYLESDIDVRREVVGGDNTLSEYLLPTFLMIVIMLFALVYVPYNLTKEEAILDRIRIESSIERLLGAKLVYFSLLMLVPILVFQGAGKYLGYASNALAPGGILALLLAFSFLSAISMSIMLFFKFSTTGQFVNVVLLLAFFTLSGLGFPVGFFSPLRKEIIRQFPTHYAMIIARGSMLKGLPMSTFTDWFVDLAGVLVAALIVLKLSAVYYRRTT